MCRVKPSLYSGNVISLSVFLYLKRVQFKKLGKTTKWIYEIQKKENNKDKLSLKVIKQLSWWMNLKAEYF